MVQYVDFEKLPDGNLKISLTEHPIWDLREDCGWDAETKTSKKILDIWEVLEFQMCNGWDMIAPERIGALTDAPIITDNLCEYSEDDPEYGEEDTFGHPKIKSLDEVWWYPNYMISDPVGELLERGYVIFTSSKNSEG